MSSRRRRSRDQSGQGSMRDHLRLPNPRPTVADDLLSASKSAPHLEFESYSSSSFTDLGMYQQRQSYGDWMSVQQMTFTNWFNDRLTTSKGSSTTGPKVRDLCIDLHDGLLLIKLLENLTGKKMKGHEKNPKVTAQKMVNLDIIFEFLRNQDIKLIGIGSQNIFQGDLKLIMGLIWTLIQKYQLRMKSTSVSTKKVMIQWLQATLPAWSISNLTTDWNDGRCLLALISEVKPGVAPDVRTLDPTKRRGNCTLAIRIAKNHLKIPALIAPEDISDPNIDELSIMTYLSYFCEPARSKLLKWIRKAIPQMAITNFSSDWADARAFGALIEYCFPGMFPEWETLEMGNGVENARLIFDVSKKRLGIEPNFTVNELVKADAEELKIMTFVLLVKNGELKPLPEEIIASGPGLLKATAGKQTHFEIDTTQAGPGRLFIDAYSETGKRVKFSLYEKLSGILTLTYTPEEAGTVNFDVLWSDHPIPKSPFSVRVTDSRLVKLVDFEYHERLVQVNTPIKLSLNTKSAGQGTITAQLQYGNEPPIQANVSEYSKGIATLRYTPQKAGKPVLQAFWNGEELTHLTITYTVVDSRKYRVTTTPEVRTYRTFEHIEFAVQSEDSLPLEILQMTAIYGDIQIPVSFKMLQGSTGQAVFTPTLPGVYRIEVACIDKLVEGSPFKVVVADPSRCKLESLLPKYLELGKAHEFRVEMKDSGEGQLQFECADRATAQVFKSHIYQFTNASLQIVSATPLQEGEYLLGIKFHGTHIPSSPFRVTVCDPSLCTVAGDLVEKKTGLVGKPIRFKIVAPPSYSTSIKPAVKAIGPSAKYSAEIRTTDDRTYAVQFTPWEIGTHEISITYGGFNIPKSPFLVAVMGFNSNICSATGTGLQESLTGVPAQFVVLAKQAGLLQDGTLQIRVAGVVNSVECKVRVRDNQNGSYNVAYLTQIPGAYLVTILAAGQHIPGSPFRLTALPGPQSDMCHMYGPALDPNTILTIGKPIDFSADCSAAGTGTLTVKAVGPGGAQARVYIAKAEKAGVHDIKIDPVRHGKYRVSVKWSGRHVPGSPFMMKIFPGADPSKCKAYGPGLEDGYVGKGSTFTIETRDAGAGTLKVRLHGVKDAFKIEIKPVDSQDVRTLRAHYNPRKPGEYLVTIKWSDQHIPGSPFRVKITGDSIEVEESNRGASATPRNPDLDVILEEDEEEGEMRTTRSDKPKMKKDKKRKRPPKGAIPVIPVMPMMAGYIDPRNMPMFDPQSMRMPYQFAFMPPPPARKDKKRDKESKTVHVSSPTKNMESKSSSSLSSEKMVTFSNLQQVHKHSRTRSAPVAREPIRGVFHGHAAMRIETYTKKLMKEKLKLKRSTSDSAASIRKPK